MTHSYSTVQRLLELDFSGAPYVHKLACGYAEASESGFTFDDAGKQPQFLIGGLRPVCVLTLVLVSYLP